LVKGVLQLIYGFKGMAGISLIDQIIYRVTGISAVEKGSTAVE
jgi:hypothetical protein